MNLPTELNYFIKENTIKDDTNKAVIYSGYDKECFLLFPKKQEQNIFRTNEVPDYCKFYNHVWQAYLENTKYWFSEKQYTEEFEYSGISIDIDAYQTEEHRKHGLEILQQACIKTLMKIIYKYVEIAYGTVTYVAILGNAAPYKKTSEIFYKEGFHILFPGIKVRKEVKVSIIRDFGEKIHKKFVNAGYNNTPNVVDKNSPDVPIQIYGSIRIEKTTSHKLQCLYQVTFDNKYTIVPPSQYEYFCRRDKTAPISKYNMCLELSLHYDGTFIKKHEYQLRVSNTDVINDNFINFTNKVNTDKDAIIKEVNILKDIYYEAAEVYNYVSCLNPKRGAEHNYQEWREIIMLVLKVNLRYGSIAKLFSIGASEDSWNNNNGIAAYTKIYEEVEAIVKKHPNPAELKQIAINQLKRYAKIDNPAEYNNVMKLSVESRLTSLFTNGMVLTQHKMAKLVHEISRDRFKAINIPKPGFTTNYYWLEYITDERQTMSFNMLPYRYKWYRHNKCPPEITDLITEDFTNILEKLKSFYDNKKKNAEDKNTKKMLEQYITKIVRAIEMCGTMAGVNNIISFCQQKFEDNNILHVLDIEKNVFGVANGVLVFHTKHKKYVEFIPGRHSYNITQTTDINYYKYDANKPTTIKVWKLLCEIIPNQKHLAALLMHFSQIFVGESAKRYLTILFSLGASGKSVLMDLFKTALGMRGTPKYCPNFGYYTTIEASTFMVDKKDINSVDHHMIRLENSKLVQCPEGKHGGTIQTHIVKKLRDDPGARSMFESIRTFNFQGIIALLTNGQINFSDYNYAIIRRTLYFKFPMKFTPNPVLPNERKIDPVIDDKKNKVSWGEAFLSILVMHWEMLQTQYDGDIERVYVESGIIEQTNEFMATHDKMSKFIIEKVIQDDDAKFTVSEFTKVYVQWYQKEIGSKFDLNPDNFIQEILEAFDSNIQTENGIKYIVKVNVKD